MAENLSDEPILDIQETYSKAEQYFEDNKRNISIIGGSILAVIAGYFAWKYVYVADLETEAQKQLFYAENYFHRDSLNLAINGDAQHAGLIEITEEYGVTKSGNLAEYYLGMSYLKKGEYENAITHLSNFKSGDHMVGPMARGAIGDAYMEQGQFDEAASHYLKAAGEESNSFISPIFLKKAGIAYEENKDYENAAKVYERIQNEFPKTDEGKNIDKYIARARALAGSN